jgi:molecular chaperone DnaK (HSP70)
MQFTDVSKLVLIGGTSSSKLVYNFWKQKIAPHQELIYHQPLSSVAKGAALYAASFSSGSSSLVTPIELRSVSTYNIGLLLSNSNRQQIDLLIHRNIPLPVSSKKVYRINPSKTDFVLIELCQFWDPQEVNVENRLNGTIGIKLKNAENGRDIKFEFIRKESGYKYDFLQQKSLLDNIYLNNYL